MAGFASLRRRPPAKVRSPQAGATAPWAFLSRTTYFPWKPSATDKRAEQKSIAGEEDVPLKKDAVEKSDTDEDREHAQAAGQAAAASSTATSAQQAAQSMATTQAAGQSAAASSTATSAQQATQSMAINQAAGQAASSAGAIAAARGASRPSLNFLPILHDQSPTGWGVTVNDDAIFDIIAYPNGANWSCVVSQADQQSHQGTRLLPGVVEVTPARVAGESSCAVLQTMITSLNSVASQGPDSGYYMLAAVQAHENVHITQYRAGLAPFYAPLKAAVEALTVPRASQPNAAAAKAAIKALPGYTVANATFHAADVSVNNASGAHAPVAPFNAAEHGVVDPMITTIRTRRTGLGCPP